jgi:hypothetical protein
VRVALLLAALAVAAGCAGSSDRYREHADAVCHDVVALADARPRAGTPEAERHFRVVLARRERALDLLTSQEPPEADRAAVGRMLRSFRRSQALLDEATRTPGKTKVSTLVAAARANDPGNREARRLQLSACARF